MISKVVMMDDLKLLQEYQQKRSEEAFAKLVNRHLNLVYSAALRVVHTPEAAQDVAQIVFMKLARKAGSIRKNVSLSGWLYRCTTYVAQTMVRTESRRQARENIQASEAIPEGDGWSVWEGMEGLLEGGMARLSNAEQDAILLRFFEGKSLREVGDTLGITDDAAQKRVNRALIRLREYFADSGLVTSSATIAPLLASHAVQSAPISMASQLAGAAMANLDQIGGTTSLLTKLLAFAKAHVGAVAGTAGFLAITAAVLLAPERSATQGRSDSGLGTGGQTSNSFALHGTVRDIGGKPVQGAMVQLATPTNYLRAYGPPNLSATTTGAKGSNVVPPKANGLSAISESNGEFTLFAPTSPTEMKMAVLATNDNGYALITGQELAANPDVILQPWARLEGVLRVGNTPETNRTVHIGIWGSVATYEWSFVSHTASAVTDAQGKFVFAKVAPGDLWLTRMVQVRSNDWRESGHQWIHLAPGETARVQLGGKGQPIIGKVEGPANVQFFGSMWAEAPGLRHPKNWNKMESEEKRIYERKWRDSPEAQKFKESVRNYEFAVRADGTFRVDDVLPGKYRMEVRAETRIPGTQKMQRAAVGDIDVEMGELPEGRTDEPFDVGVIVAK